MTYKITSKGQRMAENLRRWIGDEPETLRTLSRIGRLAATHQRLAEAECSVEMTERQAARHARRVEALEATIRRLVATLPRALAVPRSGAPADLSEPSGLVPVGVDFGGDPRGYTVKLIVPDPSAGNTWGRGGAFGFDGGGR